MKTLYYEILTAGQNCKYIETLQITAAVKLRISIKTDDVQRQSSAVIDIWDATANKWNFVESIMYGNMKTPYDLAYRRLTDMQRKNAFQADRDELLRRASLVIGFKI